MFIHRFMAAIFKHSLVRFMGLHSHPMSESFNIPTIGDRKSKYEQLIPQLKGLFYGEKNFLANCANAMAAIHYTFQFHWTGCYFVDGTELVLGPFQGPVACTRIGLGKGVCGTAWQNQSTIIVADVELFPGHIACSPFSKSEIVVPLKNIKGEVFGVLDIDSSHLNDFDETDQQYLEHIVGLLMDLRENEK